MTPLRLAANFCAFARDDFRPVTPRLVLAVGGDALPEMPLRAPLLTDARKKDAIRRGLRSCVTTGTASKSVLSSKYRHRRQDGHREEVPGSVDDPTTRARSSATRPRTRPACLPRHGARTPHEGTAPSPTAGRSRARRCARSSSAPCASTWACVRTTRRRRTCCPPRIRPPRKVARRRAATRGRPTGSASAARPARSRRADDPRRPSPAHRRRAAPRLFAGLGAGVRLPRSPAPSRSRASRTTRARSRPGTRSSPARAARPTARLRARGGRPRRRPRRRARAGRGGRPDPPRPRRGRRAARGRRRLVRASAGRARPRRDHGHEGQDDDVPTSSGRRSPPPGAGRPSSARSPTTWATACGATPSNTTPGALALRRLLAAGPRRGRDGAA